MSGRPGTDVSFGRANDASASQCNQDRHQRRTRDEEAQAGCQEPRDLCRVGGHRSLETCLKEWQVFVQLSQPRGPREVRVATQPSEVAPCRFQGLGRGRERERAVSEAPSSGGTRAIARWLRDHPRQTRPSRPTPRRCASCCCGASGSRAAIVRSALRCARAGPRVWYERRLPTPRACPQCNTESH